ncbi:MAG: UDP-N-acetylmuramoyl-tripeptide--D-alanyl-D-alanine ligase [Candidatus Andersenbacteria bacterium]
MIHSLGRRVLWQRVTDFLRTYQPLLVGVTGSAGKSLTKEAIRLALGANRRVRASHESLHHPLDVGLAILGVPLPSGRPRWFSLLTGSFVRELVEEEPDTIVVELGADRPGYIDWLAAHLPFTIGVVTNIGTTHTEFFGSPEMVAHEKMSLIVTLPRTGFAILNIDDPLVAPMAAHTQAKVVTFGVDDAATIRLVRIQRVADHGFAGEVRVAGRPYELYLPHLLTRQQTSAAVIAIAVAYVLKLDLAPVIAQLKELRPLPSRMQRLAGQSGALLLDASYTSSPETMADALRTLQALPARRRIAILGDITELGSLTQPCHRRLGTLAGKAAHIVIGVGEAMRVAGASAIRAGADVHHFEESADVGKWVSGFLRPGDVVLITGSRDMHMEQVVERLAAHP